MWPTHIGDVSVVTLETTIGAMGNYVVTGQRVLRLVHELFVGRRRPAGMANLSVSFGRWSVLGEVTAIEEVFSSRTSRFHDEDFALRETRVSMMVRRNMPAGRSSFRLMGGMSYAIADRRGSSASRRASRHLPDAIRSYRGR